MGETIYGSRNATTAERLKQIMEEKQVRQIDVANATGIPKGRISGYIAGDCTPKIDRIAILAKYFGVSEAWLWGFDAPKERSRSQKKNDQIADLVIRMEKDELFFEAVTKLNSLSVEGLKAYITLMGLQEQPKD